MLRASQEEQHAARASPAHVECSAEEKHFLKTAPRILNTMTTPAICLRHRSILVFTDMVSTIFLVCRSIQEGNNTPFEYATKIVTKTEPIVTQRYHSGQSKPLRSSYLHKS